MNTYIHLTKSGENPAIRIITIDRPPRNAMALDCYRQLLACLQEINGDQTARCVILTGAGEKSFVAGGDLKEHAELDAEAAHLRTALIRQVFNAVRQLRIPVIAAVNGYALGGGLALMASCDIVVASDNATFSLPEVKVGIMGGTSHLKRIVPEKVVRWMALTGNMVSADYLHRLGAIQEVVAPGHLMQAATRIAQDICQHSPTAIELMKETLNLTEHMALDEGYHVECYATSIMKAAPDGKEAVQAILEKRPPHFGRA
ncbi:MAG: enoyl-CoA hydratase-related protein [Alcaligenaceae bacterium]|nr:enoyl-CoA hydratase-related protein [Alcaligenaceae bacterium]